MADEAVLKVETERPINFICATTGFEKGALMTLSDPMTAAAATADGYFAGIVQSETISGGNASVALYRGGVFKMTCSAAITAGQTVVMTGTGNKVKPSTNANVASDIVGIALETTAQDGDTLFVDVRPGAAPNAYA